MLPLDCAGCGEYGTRLCRRCLAELGGGVARPVRPHPAPAGLPAVRAAVPYQGAARALLLEHKERGALWLARVLGAVLASVVHASPACRHLPRAECVLLVPVPSAPRAVRSRGHDPVRRMASYAAAELRRAGVAGASRASSRAAAAGVGPERTGRGGARGQCRRSSEGGPGRWRRAGAGPRGPGRRPDDDRGDAGRGRSGGAQEPGGGQSELWPGTHGGRIGRVPGGLPGKSWGMASACGGHRLFTVVLRNKPELTRSFRRCSW